MQNRTSSCQSQSVYAHRSSMYRTEINNKPIQLQLYQKNQKCLPLHWMYSTLNFLDVRLFFSFMPSSLSCCVNTQIVYFIESFVLSRLLFNLSSVPRFNLRVLLSQVRWKNCLDFKLDAISFFLCTNNHESLHVCGTFFHSFCYSLLFGRSKLKESNEEHKFALNEPICKLNTNLTR